VPVLTFDIDRERRDIDVSKKIFELQPDETPFIVVLSKARKQPAQSAEVVWWEDDLYPKWDKVVGAQTDTDTRIEVQTASIFAVHDVVKVPRTGEVMLVTAVGSNYIDVIRGYGVTAAAAINDQDWLLIIGNAMAERSSVPAERLGQPTKLVNYAQIFRTPYSVSGTVMAERQVTTEQERDRLSRKKAIEHRIDLERAFLFGEKKEDAVNKRRMAGGVLSFIQTNVYDAGGTLTEQEFEQFCEMGFAYGSTRKLLVCSARVITAINGFAAGKLETVSGDDTYGLRIKRYMSAHGDVDIVRSRALEKAYDGYALLLDMENIVYRPLRDTTLRRNIQNPGDDEVKDEYFTEATIEVHLEKTHAVLRGVTG